MNLVFSLPEENYFLLKQGNIFVTPENRLVKNQLLLL